MIDRELDLLERNGQLPEMPEALVEIGGSFVIEYDSPLTRMQQSEEVGGIMRTLESALPLMQLDPQIADNFDFDAMTRILARSNGAPTAIMKSLELVSEIRTQRAEQENAQAQAAMLEPASAAAKNVAQAQKFRSEAGSV
jgi:hypothetical protein